VQFLLCNFCQLSLQWIATCKVNESFAVYFWYYFSFFICPLLHLLHFYRNCAKSHSMFRLWIVVNMQCCANILNSETNRIVTSVFDLIQNERNYSKYLNTYCHWFLTYLTEWRRFFTLATTPSNQQNLLLKLSRSCISLESLYWPIMAHQVLKLLQQKPQ